MNLTPPNTTATHELDQLAEAKQAALKNSRIADISLAESGHKAIAWAKAHSPVLDGYVREVLADGALEGKRVAVVVHLEAKTAFLATVLADAGAQVVASGSNPMSTRDDVCAALVDRGIEVHASRGCGYEQWEKDMLAVAETAPEYIVDDGAELTSRMAQHRPDLFAKVKGVTEQTTTGVQRLESMFEAGLLNFGSMAANNAACKHMFDNRYGTGQSTIQAMLNLTNLLMGGKRVAIIGYGWVGKGLATYVQAMGGTALIVEVDPIAALDAHLEGHQVMCSQDALSQADFVITATGGVRAIGVRHFEHLKPGAILCNAGHHDLEIDTVKLREESSQVVEVREQVERYMWRGEKPLYVLASGALVNIAGGLGHPVEIMDLSFAVQGLGCHYLAANELSPGVHVIPRSLDEQIAAAKLAHHGVTLDELHEDQAEQLSDFMG